MASDPKGWHRRLALQIASQLPDEPEDARAVLQIVEQLVNFCFVDDPPPPKGGGDQAVLRFPGGGPATPRRRASSKGIPSELPK